MMRFVIAYDIRNIKRLQRVHRTLVRKALPIQYSVFIFKGTPDACSSVLREVIDLLDLRRDDLRSYPLPEHGRSFHAGKPVLPAGILWSGFCSSQTRPFSFTKSPHDSLVRQPPSGSPAVGAQTSTANRSLG